MPTTTKRPAAKKANHARKGAALNPTPSKKVNRKESPLTEGRGLSDRVKTKKGQKEVSSRYYESVGRRKTAVARIRISKQPGEIMVNQKNYQTYFPVLRMQQAVISPLKKIDAVQQWSVSAVVRGGGIYAQAEAIRHGIARALIKYDADVLFRKQLKEAGFLKRDSRMKERRKFGLKKARKAPQWSKR